MGQAATSLGQGQHLNFDSLVGLIRERFHSIPDNRRSPVFSLADTLMAGLAIFCLKDPSLLAFCRRPLDHNLRSVFGLQAIPSDTHMRSILDEVAPEAVRPAFTDVFRQLQRAKVLEQYVFLQGCYLIALDGVQYFCSNKVHCSHCQTRHHSNGEVSYSHQMLGAVLLHPDFPEVIPLAPEPIQRSDGDSKNDCERNAARRWLVHFRKDHPRLPVIIIEDALSPNAPHIRDLIDNDCHFILAVKENDHSHLFKQYEQLVEDERVGSVHEEDATGANRSWLFANDLALNESNPDVLVNLLVYVEVDDRGDVHQWAWVSDLTLTADNVQTVARGGRARWKIENETFNTLKNQGYNLEHNYGHGKEHLSVVLMTLMMLAFLVDQVQQLICPVFQGALEKLGTKKLLWDRMRALFHSCVFASMLELYEALRRGIVKQRPLLQGDG